jgi:hypothetical protein
MKFLKHLIQSFIIYEKIRKAISFSFYLNFYFFIFLQFNIKVKSLPPAPLQYIQCGSPQLQFNKVNFFIVLFELIIFKITL